MIWHVVRKDLRSQWWLGPVLVAAAIGYALSLEYHFGSPTNGAFTVPVIFGPYVAAAMALARAVQIDSPAMPRGDWHTRPMGRWTLLLGKAALAFFGVLLPWALIDLVWGLDWGLSPAAAAAGALTHMLTLICGLVLVMALAAATRSLITLLLSLVGIVCAGVFTMGLFGTVAAGLFPQSQMQVPVAYFSTGLLMDALALAAAILLVAVFLLYHRRRIRIAWMFILVASLGVELLALSATRAFALNWPGLGREPEAARNIVLSVSGQPRLFLFGSMQQLTSLRTGKTDMAAGQLNLREIRPEPQSQSRNSYLQIPLNISAPPNITLEVDRRRIDSRWANGGAATTVLSTGGVLGGFDLGVLTRTEDPGAARSLTAKYRLYVHQTLAPVTLHSVGPVSLPDGGTCRWMHSDGVPDFAGVLRCISAAPLCLALKGETDTGRIWTGRQCGNRNRSLTGFYELSSAMPTPADLAVVITQERILGLIDRSVVTGWFTPTIDPAQQPPSSQPAKATASGANPA